MYSKQFCQRVERLGGKTVERKAWSLSPQPKQLFAKLKQEANLERTKSKRSCSSEKEHKVNALAPRAEEGRDNLR